MRSFFDSSAFAKRYVDEDGSGRIEEICQHTSELALSVICVPEIVSALNRRRREKTLSAPEYREAKTHLLEDIRDAVIVNLSPGVIERSVVLLENHSLRAMDALHIACALEWGADNFVSADKQQTQAARKAGLTTLLV
ncbi:MAG: type II toxin-antitoxin system VapC family toxin [Candidatus Hydrogenedentes bacterium]|nr:type II toxin-antitoxin system VapC family toxin [Candidatus Hydrogenedentota bacterium]